MNDYFTNYLNETGLNKKIILFIFGQKYPDENYRNKNILNGVLNIESTYFISEYNSFVEIVLSKEMNKINCENYLFIIYTNDSNICFSRSIRLLIKEKINHRIFSIKDLEILKKIFFRKYLSHRGIDIAGSQININNFVFDNPLLFDNIKGVFDCGDLILPSFFNDYSVIDEGSYEYDKVIVEKDDIVFDCGANVGSFSALALSKGAVVHSFEPIHETFLLQEYYLRDYQNFKLYLNNLGLSNHKDFIDFYIRDTNGANGYVDIYDSLSKQQCEVTTIDEYVKEKNLQKVDFIKADIEGAERDMLVGAIDTIKKFKPKLSICTYHLNDDPKVIEDIIRSACEEYKIIHKWQKCYAYV